jgi:hypothetical protein
VLESEVKSVAFSTSNGMSKELPTPGGSDGNAFSFEADVLEPFGRFRRRAVNAL